MKLEQAQKEQLTHELQKYFEAELDIELGGFDTGFLLDFLSEKLGPYYYNQGLQDAQVVLAKKLEEVENALYDIEKPIR